MYLKHGLLYLLAKVAPAMASFVMLAAYTRWMSTTEYGIFSTILVLASSATLFVFGWLYVGIMRFWDQRALTAAAAGQLITLSVVLLGGVVGILSALAGWWSGQWAVAFGFFAVFSSAAFYEAYQRINSITLAVKQYVWTELGRTLVTLVSGITLVGAGYAWQGAVGAVVWGVVVVLILSGALWQQFAWHWRTVDLAILQRLLRYGLPLSLSFVLLEVIHSSDRVMLGWLRGYAETGEYAVAYNLVFQMLMILSSSLNLAAYPLVIRALEQQGKVQAEARLREYGLVLLGVSLPALLGLLAIADAFVPLIVGAEFVEVTLALLPWLGVAIWANCVYLFYVSLAFQLAERTGDALKVVAGAVVLNLGLNLLLIPAFGVWGAAFASLLAYGWCVGYGYYLGNKLFTLALPMAEVAKILLAAGVMYILLLRMPTLALPAMALLCLKIALGVLLYASAIWLLNPAQVRHWLKQQAAGKLPWQTLSISSLR